jgi:hypothetical protein
MSKIPALMSGRKLEHSANIIGNITSQRGLVSGLSAKVGGQVFSVYSGTVTNTIAATNFTSVTLPAGTLTQGALLRVSAIGGITNQNAADTFGIKLRLSDGTLTIDVATIAARDPATADVFYVQADVHVPAYAVSGSVRTIAHSAFGAAPLTDLPQVSGGTLNTTVACTLALEGTWNVANVNNVAVLRALSVEIVGG